MRNDYRHMIGQISLSETARAAIAARLDAPAPRHRHRPARILLAAACMAALLVSTAAAAGIHLQIHRQLANGAEFHYESIDGIPSGSSAVTGESPVVLRDGRFYLVLDGVETDITGQFSETEYYLYRSEHEDGSWEDTVIGGTEEAYGYAIYVYDADGRNLGGLGGGTYADNMAPVPWREAYHAEHPPAHVPVI